MFDLAETINFGQKITINETEYIVVKKFILETKTFAVVVKADEIMPAVCYLIKIPETNTT